MRNTRTAAGFGHMPSKTHAEKMLHVTFGIHKTTIFCPLVQAEPLAEIPWRRSCETLEQQQDSGKNNNLLSSRASRTISRNPLEAQLRNTRTAAGFGHMPSKTHAEKVLHVTFGIHKTTIFCPLEQAEPLAEIPWRRSCETLEQQQDSGTCQAKRTPKKCFTSPLESIKTTIFCPLEQAEPLAEIPWRRMLRNTRTAAGFGHMPSKTHAEKVLYVTFGIHKTTIFCPLEQAKPLAEIPWRRSCETFEQQQDSGTCQAKRTPRESRASRQNASHQLNVSST